jgi:hypothetical protein
MLKKKERRNAYLLKKKIKAQQQAATIEEEIQVAIDELAKSEGKPIAYKHLKKYMHPNQEKTITAAEIELLKVASNCIKWRKLPMSIYLRMLDLSFFSDAKPQDIARISGVTTTTVTTKVSQVRRILRLMERVESVESEAKA